MSILSSNEKPSSSHYHNQAIGFEATSAVAFAEANRIRSSSEVHLDDLIHGTREVTLPMLATANDVREVVQYLKKRPEGVNIFEVAQPIKKRIFYLPKVAAYEAWGIVTRKDDRLTLAPQGWAIRSISRARSVVFSRIAQ